MAFTTGRERSRLGKVRRMILGVELKAFDQLVRTAVTVESKVTIAAARFLGKANWPVISIALPSGGSGLTFRSDVVDEPVLIPDIVARDSGHSRAILVEAKPALTRSDADKLLTIRAGGYENSIRSTLSLSSAELILGLAFVGGSDIHYESLGIDLVLTLDENNEIMVKFDRLSLFS